MLLPNAIFSKIRRPLVSEILLVIAMVICGWLALTSVRGSAIAGCGPTQGCSQVLGSDFSRILGIPAAILGLSLYFATLALLVSGRRHLANFAAVAIISGAVWFVGVQGLVLKAWCPWCCTTHLLASVAAFGVLARNRFNPVRFIPPFAALIGLLALAHTYGPRKERSVFQSAATSKSHLSSYLAISEKGDVVLFDNAVSLNPRFNPIIGERLFLSPSQAVAEPLQALMAPQPVVVLSDWTCAHCRELYGKILTAAKQKSDPQGDFAQAIASTSFVMLPAWRDDAGKEAQRLMLSAFFLDSARFETLAAELENGKTAATPAAIAARSRELFGNNWETLTTQVAALVKDQLDLGASTLAKSDSLQEVASLPQIISAAGILTGTPSDKALTDFLGGSHKAINQEVAEFKTEAKPNASQIQFVSSAVETPEVKSGEIAKAEFHFTNTGTEPLSILAVRTSCGCTVVDGWKQTVLPGKSGSFTVSVDTKDYTSTVIKPVNLVTNARNSAPGGLVPIRVVAKILPSVAISAPVQSRPLNQTASNGSPQP